MRKKRKKQPFHGLRQTSFPSNCKKIQAEKNNIALELKVRRNNQTPRLASPSFVCILKKSFGKNFLAIGNKNIQPKCFGPIISLKVDDMAYRLLEKNKF